MENKTYTLRRPALLGGRKPSVLAVFAGLETFAFSTLIYSLFAGNVQFELLCAVTMLLFVCPFALETLCSMRMPAATEIICMVFCTGSMLGHVYGLYYSIPFFDKILHTSSGVIVACIGFSLPDIADRGNSSHSFLLKCLSALMLALSVAAVWEFFEYSMDTFFGTDMQNDTLVKSFSSYYTAGNNGSLDTFSDITGVLVDGKHIVTGGYLDIGIIDTMNDMLVCTAGALAFIGLALPCRGKLVRGLVPSRADVDKADDTDNN